MADLDDLAHFLSAAEQQQVKRAANNPECVKQDSQGNTERMKGVFLPLGENNHGGISFTLVVAIPSL